MEECRICEGKQLRIKDVQQQRADVKNLSSSTRSVSFITMSDRRLSLPNSAFPNDVPSGSMPEKPTQGDLDFSEELPRLRTEGEAVVVQIVFGESTPPPAWSVLIIPDAFFSPSGIQATEILNRSRRSDRGRCRLVQNVRSRLSRRQPFNLGRNDPEADKQGDGVEDR